MTTAIPSTPIAQLSENDARRICATVFYSDSTAAESMSGQYDVRYSCCRLFVNDPDFPSGTLPSRDTGSVLGQLRARTAARLLHSVMRDKATFLSDSSALSSWAREALHRSVPPRTMAAALEADHAIEQLEMNPDAAALPLLRKAAATTTPSRFWDSLASLPLLKNVLASRKYGEWLGEADFAIWAAENLPGKSPELVPGLLRDLYGTPRTLGYFARKYLETNHPESAAAAIVASCQSLDASMRGSKLREYYIWGRDPAVALAFAADADSLTRFHANLRLYDLTGDSKYVASLLSGLPPLAGALSPGVPSKPGYATLSQTGALAVRTKSAPVSPAGVALAAGTPNTAGPTNSCYRMLAEVYFRYPAPEIADALRAALSALPNGPAGLESYTAEPLAAVLILARGRANFDAAIAIVDTCKPMPNGDGLILRHAIKRCGDPEVIDALVELLSKRSPDFRGRLCEAVVEGLAARGDERILPLIEAALVQEASAPSSYKAEDSNAYGRAITIGDMLSRAALIVQMRTAADPLAFLLEMPDAEMAALSRPAAELLAERFTADQLRLLLSDRRYAFLRDAIYCALLFRTAPASMGPLDVR